MGRLSKLTPEITKEIAANIYPAGNYFEVACELAGVSVGTAYRWLEIANGKKPNTTRTPMLLYRDFRDAVDKANAQVEAAAVISWRSAFSGDWRAAAEYLARRFPERWKKVERAEITGKDGAPLLPVPDLIAALKQAESELSNDAG